MSPEALVAERKALVLRVRAIAGLVTTHTLSEMDDARVVGMCRGLAFRLSEIDAQLATRAP